MDPSAKNSPTRKHDRFKAAPTSYAQIELEIREGSFKPQIIGLIANESYSGCALVILQTPGLVPVAGALCRIQMGSLNPVKAEIVWVKPIDAETSRAGFRYLD